MDIKLKMATAVIRSASPLAAISAGIVRDITTNAEFLKTKYTEFKELRTGLSIAKESIISLLKNFSRGFVGSDLRKMLEVFMLGNPGFEEAEFISRYFGDNLKYVEFVQSPCLAFIDMAYYYAMLSKAIYSPKAEQFFREEWKNQKETKWLEPIAVAQYSLRERPRFGYYIDHYRKTLLLLVRGISEVIIDGATDVEFNLANVDELDLKVNGGKPRMPTARDFELLPQEDSSALPPGSISLKIESTDHMAHHGFIQSARNIVRDQEFSFEDVYNRATEILGFKPSIYVTGHSLGASTSACIVYILRKSGFDARGVLFAPAPCFTQQLIVDEPDACKNYIISFVNRFDVVTHADPGILQRSEIITSSSISNDPSVKVRMVDMNKMDEIYHKEAVAKFLSKLSPVLTTQEATEIVEEDDYGRDIVNKSDKEVEISKIARTEERYLRSKLVTLTVPGRPYWLHYYYAENSKSTAGLYKIKSNNFFDFLPVVYANTGVFNTTNIAADHSMLNYCAHLYYIRRALTPEHTKLPESSSGSATTQDKKPETLCPASPVSSRYMLPPTMRIAPRRDPVIEARIASAKILNDAIMSKPVEKRPRSPVSTGPISSNPEVEAEWKSWLSNASKGLTMVDRRAESMHPGVAAKREAIKRKEMEAILKRYI